MKKIVVLLLCLTLCAFSLPSHAGTPQQVEETFTASGTSTGEIKEYGRFFSLYISPSTKEMTTVDQKKGYRLASKQIPTPFRPHPSQNDIKSTLCALDHYVIDEVRLTPTELPDYPIHLPEGVVLASWSPSEVRVIQINRESFRIESINGDLCATTITVIGHYDQSFPPETGDGALPFLWCGLTLLSLTGATLLLKRRKIG